jgi:hypothetical protein
MLMSSDASNPPSRGQIHFVKIKESAQTGTDRIAWYHTGYVIDL